MGIVYKASQLSLNRPVALKMIKACAVRLADEVRRFQNESEAVARLVPPNIVAGVKLSQGSSFVFRRGQAFAGVKLCFWFLGLDGLRTSGKHYLMLS